MLEYKFVINTLYYKPLLAWYLSDWRHHLIHKEFMLWIQINQKNNSLTEENEDYHGGQLGSVYLQEKQMCFFQQPP